MKLHDKSHDIAVRNGKKIVAHIPESVTLLWGFYHCEKEERLCSEESAQALEDLINKSGFRVLRFSYEKFNDGGEGYTAVAIIGESSIDFHTWPEYGTVLVDVHYCNYTEDNSGKAVALYNLLVDFFSPQQIRGDLDAPIKRPLTLP